MANIKQVEIRGRVPFCWLTDWNQADALTDEDAAFLARLFLTPTTGLYLSYIDDGYELNACGGATNMQTVHIIGEEAISEGALRRIVDLIAQVGTVTVARMADLENGEAFRPIRTWAQLEEDRRAAEAHVAAMMVGHHWVHEGNTARLVED